MSPTEAINNNNKENPSPQAGGPGGENVPSGFILKLFQMVNGAPNEVIRWTSDGDAFIIGSDLERLESETLPQYFRHNRFQSLVRQLNFYSFRKINRERNVWIYKHNLFHRDRPEDLYMVRRRTCPGLDGRKQRFSSRSKVKKSDDNANNSDEETTSVGPDEQHQVIEESSSNDSASGPMKKRDSLSSRASEQLDLSESKPKPKRARHDGPDTSKSAPHEAPDSPIVDTSILREVVEANSSSNITSSQGEDDQNSIDHKRNEKLEMLEQSMIVSDVAMKLEEYAKRARKNGLVLARSRRNGAGVVTPPFGSTAYQVSMSASELLTYDDEYDSSDEDLRVTELFGIHSTSSVVTDTDLEEAEEERFETRLPKELLIAPVLIPQAKSITERLLMKDVVAGAVAGFCMSNAPNGNPDQSRKILQLIASCEALADEFHQYRSALKPEVHSGEQLNNGSPFHHVRMNHVQNWEREGSRSDAVRDFKVFSVNCIRKILGKHGGFGDVTFDLLEGDRAALDLTADVWLKSVGMTNQPKPLLE